MTYSIPPKPVNSPKLRNGRFQIDIGRPKGDGSGHHIVHTTLRYVTEKAARKVAGELPNDAEHALVNITWYSPRNLHGPWSGQHVAQRRNGEWEA